MAVISALLILT